MIRLLQWDILLKKNGMEHKQVNLLVLGLGTTVGFIEWLDFRAVLPDAFIIKFAFAIYDLPAAHGTSLYVAAEDVKLAFPHGQERARPYNCRARRHRYGQSIL